MSTALIHDPKMIDLAARLRQPERYMPIIGVHPGVPEGIYHGAWNAASNSRLKELERSPAHMLAYITNPPDSTKALDFGRALHMAVLEPERFAVRYICGPEGNWAHKGPKDEVARLRAENAGCDVVKPDEYAAVLAARESIMRHPKAGRLIDLAEYREVSIAWDEEQTSVRCKARPDLAIVNGPRRILGDIKTTTDAGPASFHRALFSYRYDRQAALYLDGATDVWNGAFDDFVFIAVEKTPPFAVAVYRITDRALRDAMTRVRALLHQYRECMETQVFPAYGDEVIDLGPLDEPVPYLLEA